MDFRFSPEDESFRDEVRAWLETSVPAWWGCDTDPPLDEETRFSRRRAWQATLHEAGLVGATWPVRYGGGGRTAVQNAILQEEMVRADAPGPVNTLGIGLCGPAILQYGTEEQRQRFLRPMLTAEEIWCQGYSEPDAGSDLANLKTRAVLHGESYVVNGQKIWTSLAHRADWCFCLVRTDPDAPKHDGIGFLLIDMHSPGIEVRPIVQLTGEREFNEVFFRDVAVPRENMVGEPSQGWRIANTVLGYERGATTLSMYASYRRLLGDLVHMADGRGHLVDPRVRQRVAATATEIEILRLHSLRQLTRLAHGERPGPESSIQKLYWSELDQRFHRLAVDLQGTFGQLVRGSPRAVEAGRWQFGELNSLRFTIARGTSEIQRNIIAERALGLPRR